MLFGIEWEPYTHRHITPVLRNLHWIPVFVAPHMWNQFPDNVRAAESLVSSKTLLKTHLFRAALLLVSLYQQLVPCIGKN